MKDKTKELADSVGAVYPVLFMGRHDGVLFTETELETFVELVAAAEREACAKVCEERGMVKGGEVLGICLMLTLTAVAFAIGGFISGVFA